MTLLNPRGAFIAFEGAEGVGKSTQVGLTHAYLDIKEYASCRIRHPGNPMVGLCVDMREILFGKPYSKELDSTELVLLFYLDYHANAKFVRRQMARGISVVTDRWNPWSTMAYEIVYPEPVPDLPGQLFKSLLFDPNALHPDALILLDYESQVGAHRAVVRTGKKESQADKQWGQDSTNAKLRPRYLEMARQYPDMWNVVQPDPQETPEEVFINHVQPIIDRTLAKIRGY